MKQIESDGKLNDWCADNLNWLKKNFGAENVVSAVLHLDEKTPHIHATVVPVVTGERRNAKQEQQSAKKKPTNAPRLCADDLTSREKWKHYQDIYAIAMNKYGLQRDVDDSEVRHISTQQFYRDLSVKNESLKENIVVLQEEKDDVYEKVRDMYDRKDKAQDKFLAMNEHIKQENKELAKIEAKLQTARQQYEPYKAQDELNLIPSLFPMMKENLWIAELCKKIGLAV